MIPLRRERLIGYLQQRLRPWVVQLAKDVLEQHEGSTTAHIHTLGKTPSELLGRSGARFGEERLPSWQDNWESAQQEIKDIAEGNCKHCHQKLPKEKK